MNRALINLDDIRTIIGETQTFNQIIQNKIIRNECRNLRSNGLSYILFWLSLNLLEASDLKWKGEHANLIYNWRYYSEEILIEENNKIIILAQLTNSNWSPIIRFAIVEWKTTWSILISWVYTTRGSANQHDFIQHQISHAAVISTSLRPF